MLKGKEVRSEAKVCAQTLALFQQINHLNLLRYFDLPCSIKHHNISIWSTIMHHNIDFWCIIVHNIDMKTNKKDLINQRRIIEQKLKPFVKMRTNPPPSGWLKAVRGALGCNTRQLADLMGVLHSSVQRLEKREQEGKATLELLEKAASAMNCKVVYAIVPKEPYDSLDEILTEKSKKLASDLLKKVDHTMRLEQQGTERSKEQLEQLAKDLKESLDSRIWDSLKTQSPKKKATK